MAFWKREKNELSIVSNNKPIFSTASNELFANYYKNNSLINKSISVLSRTISTVKMQNTYKGFINFLQNLVCNLFIYGNVFIYKKQILPFCSIIVNDLNEIVSYRYKINNHNYEINTHDLLHIKFPNALRNDFYGISPVATILKSLELYNSVSNYIIGIIQNGGRPSGILSYEGTMNKFASNELKDKFQTMYDNMNTGSAMVLEGKYLWQQIGVSPEKLNILDHKMKSEQEIIGAFGIPPVLMGIYEIKFASYKEARLQFMEDTIIPTLKWILDELNNYWNSDIIIEEIINH